MHSAIEAFVRRRAKGLGISFVELCKRAGISRQTLYELGQVPRRLPSLTTVVALADVLEVHPMRLLQLIFDEVPMRPRMRESDLADRSAFLRDVTIPDGQIVGSGERFCKIWELQNVGRVNWVGRTLVCQDDEVVVYSRARGELSLAPAMIADQSTVPVPDTPAGETVQVRVWFTAPKVPGAVVSYWKMAYPDGSLCFPDSQGVWVRVRVITPGRVANNVGY